MEKKPEWTKFPASRRRRWWRSGRRTRGSIRRDGWLLPPKLRLFAAAFARCGQTFCIQVVAAKVRRDSPGRDLPTACCSCSPGGDSKYGSVRKGRRRTKHRGNNGHRERKPAPMTQEALRGNPAELQRSGVSTAVSGWPEYMNCLRRKLCWTVNFTKTRVGAGGSARSESGIALAAGDSLEIVVTARWRSHSGNFGRQRG